MQYQSYATRESSYPHFMFYRNCLHLVTLGAFYRTVMPNGPLIV